MFIYQITDKGKKLAASLNAVFEEEDQAQHLNPMMEFYKGDMLSLDEIPDGSWARVEVLELLQRQLLNRVKNQCLLVISPDIR